MIGDGGSAAAFLRALPRAERVLTAAATGRRGVEDADLIVHATPVRDDVVVRVATGPDADRPAVSRLGHRRGRT